MRRPPWLWPLVAAASVFGFVVLGIVIYITADKGRIKADLGERKSPVKIKAGEFEPKPESKNPERQADGSPRPDQGPKVAGGEGRSSRVANLDPVNRVVGRWLHTGGPNRDLPVEFKSDGTSLIRDRLGGKRSQSGAKLTLRWLDQKAPNGVFWIDEVQLSADGRQYQGKDVFGKPVTGVRVAEVSGTVDKPEHVGKDVKETWTILSREIDGKKSL